MTGNETTVNMSSGSLGRVYNRDYNFSSSPVFSSDDLYYIEYKEGHGWVNRMRTAPFSQEFVNIFKIIDERDLADVHGTWERNSEVFSSISVTCLDSK